ncbi:MAG: hypothetical protein ACN6P2_08730 [Pseudomonas palmensis]|uniref:hypothetical protein n=1 Tax=Pseudomonas palmensis TaxID=2815362 RepID=UPI003D0FA1D9
MSFQKITGIKIDARKLPKHTWNADLIEFDGPLLSLYKSEQGEDLLYVWLDCTDLRNRWAVVPVSRRVLRGYLEQELTLREAFLSSEYIVVFHTSSGAKRSAFLQTAWNLLPEDYLPDEDSYLYPEISTQAAKQLADEVSEEYALGLDGEMYIEDLANIPKIYQQLYSFHYGLEHLDRPAVFGALSRLASKWTGGFSSVNIFSGLSAVTPSIHRPRVTELRFNSPGHIKIDLLPDLAARIEDAAEVIIDEDSYSALEQFYGAVYRYFKENKLAGFDDERELNSVVLAPEISERLGEYVDYFFELMSWSGYVNLFGHLDVSPLHQLRVLLAYYRRLRKLRPYLVGGTLFLGRSRLLS